MQNSRLFEIVYHLLAHGSATAPELAQRLGVSVRTIYRDVDALSGAGIPLYTEPGRSGGIRLLDGFVLDKAMLTAPEKQEILAALQNLQAAPYAANSATLQKLSALFGVKPERWLEVDLTRWGHSGADNATFELLKAAILSHHCVRLHYAGAYHAAAHRVVEPVRLCYKSKAWYLNAFCRQRQDWRLFKLNRILSATLLNDTFTPRPPPPNPANENTTDNTPTPPDSCTELVLRFAPCAAYRVYDEFDATQIEPQPDGSLLARATMPQDGWLAGYLLSFGTQVEIMAPTELKTILAQLAKETCEHHKP